MGCDQFGRDILSRVMVGTTATLGIAVGVVILGALVGLLIGGLAGYYGGWIDEVIMRTVDALFAFPSILLALLVIGLLGAGTYQIVLALGIAFVPSFARIVRAEYMHYGKADFVLSAKLDGASDLRIMFLYILPNMWKVFFSALMIGFNNAVLAEAGMSYLGIGVQPPDSSLGRMLSEAQTYLFSYPAYALFPGLVILLAILGFTLIGENINVTKR